MVTINISPESLDLYNKVASCISGYKKLLLSYSGGLDSTVLLDILTNLQTGFHYLISFPIALRVIYIHHGISKYADAWADHCAKQCKIRNVPFYVIYIDCCHIKNKQHNIELLARNLRYQALCNHLHADEILLTAHHMDDQVESVFLALKRGSGPAGLSGIAKNVLFYNKCRLLRPLLHCSRKQLEIYAHQKKLIWIEDDTNIDLRLDRNFLRIKILPLLYKRWPQFNQVITRTAQLCNDQENVLNEFLSKYLNKLIDISDGSLYFQPLFRCSIPKRNAVLRRWLAYFSMQMPSYQLINRIWYEVILSRQDATPILQLNKYICRRFREKLYILPKSMRFAVKKTVLSWEIENHLISLPHDLGVLTYQLLGKKKFLSKNILNKNLNINFALNFSRDIFEKPRKILTLCYVRSPQYNEKISIIFGNMNGLVSIVGRNHSRHLKKIWQELNIPPWIRSRIPLLFYNNILITAVGVFITKNGKIENKQQESWQIFWLLQDVLYYKIFKNSIKRYLK